jgi:hypothetical protein
MQQADAAFHLGISPATLRGPCCKAFDIERWPHRELKAVRGALLYFQQVGPAEDAQFLQ